MATTEERLRILQLIEDNKITMSLDENQGLALVDTQDEVALAAVIARLVRVGEASLATLLEFSYRQI